MENISQGEEVTIMMIAPVLLTAEVKADVLAAAMMTSSRMAGTPMVVVMMIIVPDLAVSRMIDKAALMENTAPLKGKEDLVPRSGIETKNPKNTHLYFQVGVLPVLLRYIGRPN
jgi:hypothetical protein